MDCTSSNVRLEKKTAVDFDSSKCIICQKSSKLKLSSTENGRAELMQAATKKKDDVFKRIQMVDGPFYYHVDNNCYKRHKLEASRIEIMDEVKKQESETRTDEPERKRRRLNNFY